MNKFIDELIKLADNLDTNGLSNEASEVDCIIKIAGEHAGIVKTFAKDLISAFENVAKSPELPGINETNIKDIISVIQVVMEKGTYLAPTVSMKTIEDMTDKANIWVDSFLELTSSLKKMRQEFATEKDPEKIKYLKMDIEADERSLDKVKKEITVAKEGRRAVDKELYERFLKKMKQRTGKEI